MEIEKSARNSSSPELNAEQLRIIMDSIPAYVSYVDSAMIYRFVNQAYLDFYNRPRDEIIGKHAREVLGESYYVEAKERIQAVLSGQKVQFETLYRHGDREIYLSANYIPSIDVDGLIEGYFVLVNDITERKKAEDALRESEERYRTISEDLPILICRFLPGGEITHVNKAYCEYFTKTSEELVGSSFLSLIPEEDQEAVMANISALRDESPSQRHEHRVMLSNGKIHWHRWTNHALFDDQGRAIAYQSIGEDITDCKRAEGELERIEWMLSRNTEARIGAHDQGYGDLTELNRDGIILKSIGHKRLMSFAHDYLDLLGTSSAIYEVNGDYAFGIFSSGWCQMMDSASRKLCNTPDNAEALNSGRWLCHESCWTDCSKEAIAKCAPVDIECKGGIRLYAVPILAHGNVIGAINFGYGDPPKDPEKLKTLADAYHLNHDDLLREATEYDSRPPYITEMAKRRLNSTARLIGSMVETEQATMALREAQAALQESEAMLNRIFQLAPDLIAVANTNEGYFTQVNPALTRMLGYSPEEFLLRPFMDFIHHEDRDATMQTIEIQQDGKPVHAFVNRYRSKEGSYVPIEWHATPAHNDGTVYAIGRDVSERQQAEEQLKQAHKMEAIGTLAGGIAHDFNNILGIIMGCTQLSMGNIPEEDEAHEFLAETLKATNRAKDLVKQILTFSRQSKQDERPLALGIIVKEALKMLRASLPTTIEIQHDISGGVGLVMADPTQMHQVIMNLSTNAAHAMREEGGVLRVEVKNVSVDEEAARKGRDLRPGAYVKLAVSDTGHGIEPEDMERILDPYFTTKKVGEGTGLGLSVVHGIIVNHDGIMDVSSEPGRGTTFELLFPKLDMAEDLTKVDETETYPTGTESVLFVDDEPGMTRAYKAMLERLGYTVTVRTSSVEALEAFRAQSDGYDVVITDQTMPHLTGQMLAREMMAIRSDIPIILCTGHSDTIDKIRAEGMGIRAFVMKPIAMGEMARTIREVLDGR